MTGSLVPSPRSLGKKATNPGYPATWAGVPSPYALREKPLSSPSASACCISDNIAATTQPDDAGDIAAMPPNQLRTSGTVGAAGG